MLNSVFSVLERKNQVNADIYFTMLLYNVCCITNGLLIASVTSS